VKIKNNRGSVTIYICIALSAILIVTGVFTDAGRLKLAQSQLQRACKISLLSLLACYNNRLKDDYGLFGVHIDRESMEDNFSAYLLKNLNIYGKKNFLYDYNIEKIYIEQLRNLENKDVFEGQIVDFMKYRTALELAKELTCKLKGVKSIVSGSSAYKRKIETDSEAGVIGNLQIILESGIKNINNMDIVSKLTSLKNEFLIQDKKHKEYLQKLLLLNEKYSSGRDSASDSFERIRQIVNSTDSSKQIIKNNIVNIVDKFKCLNTEAIENAGIITAKKQQLMEKIKIELQYADRSEDGIQELIDSYKNDLSYMKQMITEDNSESIVSSLEKNVENCISITAKAYTDEQGFLSELDSLNPDSINYLFNKTQPAEYKEKDNRDKIEKSVKTMFGKTESKRIPDSVKKLLPSQKAYNSKSPEIDWKDIDLDNEDHAENILEQLSQKESRYAQIISEIPEQLLVNEYIMGTFKHDVPLLEGENSSSAYNLRSKDKAERDAFFDKCEVEYVINGNDDEAENSLLTRSKILPVRLVSNVIHIYGNQSKMNRINVLAASLGTISSGLAVPVLRSMLVFSWAMAESVYDLNELVKGKKVPLFKSERQWATDISGTTDTKIKNSGEKSEPLSLSYHDYLRIFLLFMDKGEKLSRIQDLTQINIGLSRKGFLLKDCSTMLKANTEASVRNMFVSFQLTDSVSGKKLSRSRLAESFSIGY
jgi:hypothetical protein